LNKKILVGVPVATASVFGGKFLSFDSFSKKTKICQIFPYKLPKIGKKKSQKIVATGI
jgi:hypothetical protein